MKHRIRLVACSFIAIVILAVLTVPRARAEISHVTVAIDGLGCPFCTYGIEKKHKEVEGVRDVEISLRDGLATSVVAEQAAPDVEQVRTAVEKAGCFRVNF